MDQTHASNHDRIQVVDDNLRYGFAQVPRPVLKAQGLTLKAKAVYIALLDYAWQAGSCFPGQQRLAEDLDVSIDTVQRALGELRSFGLVDWERQGLNRPNIYFILRLSDNPNLDLGSAGHTGDRKVRPQETAALRRQDTARRGTKHTQRTTPSRNISSNKRSLIYQAASEGIHVAGTDMTREQARGGPVVALGRLLPQPSSVPRPTVGDTDAVVDDRAIIAAYLDDFARALNDRAPRKSSLTRVLNLYRTAGVSREDFISVLYQAQSITAERRRSDPGVSNTMAYFFGVVADLLGRIGSDGPARNEHDL